MEPSSRMPRVIYVVLPAYNEASSIGAVLDALARTAEQGGMVFHAIVVDDGSLDSTAEVARSHDAGMPVSLLEHSTNLGLGTAIRDGLLKAVDLAAGRDIIVTMDADDTHAPAAILGMVAKIDQGHDVLIASRYQDGSWTVGVPLSRRFLSYGASLLFRMFFPIRGVRDYTCGYRAYRASVLQDAVARYRREFINQDGFQCMVDILLKLRLMPLSFGEVPMILRYDRKAGKSKMKVARTMGKTLWLLVTRRLGL